jgi:hypothetical protein
MCTVLLLLVMWIINKLIICPGLCISPRGPSRLIINKRNIPDFNSRYITWFRREIFIFKQRVTDSVSLYIGVGGYRSKRNMYCGRRSQYLDYSDELMVIDEFKRIWKEVAVVA